MTEETKKRYYPVCIHCGGTYHGSCDCPAAEATELTHQGFGPDAVFKEMHPWLIMSMRLFFTEWDFDEPPRTVRQAAVLGYLFHEFMAGAILNVARDRFETGAEISGAAVGKFMDGEPGFSRSLIPEDREEPKQYETGHQWRADESFQLFPDPQRVAPWAEAGRNWWPRSMKTGLPYMHDREIGVPATEEPFNVALMVMEVTDAGNLATVSEHSQTVMFWSPKVGDEIDTKDGRHLVVASESYQHNDHPAFVVMMTPAGQMGRLTRDHTK